MIRGLFIFLALFTVFFMGIRLFVAMSAREIWGLTKLIYYSMMCSVLSIGVLFLIVSIF